MLLNNKIHLTFYLQLYLPHIHSIGVASLQLIPEGVVKLN